MGTCHRSCCSQQDTLWSKAVVSQPYIWALGWLRFQQVSHLLWFRCTFLGAGLISQWGTALSLEHCRGNRHKGKSGYFILLPWCISLYQSPSMGSPLRGVPEDLLCPERRGRKALLQCLHFVSLTKKRFSWFCSSSFAYPFFKKPDIKIQKPPPEIYQKDISDQG